MLCAFSLRKSIENETQQIREIKQRKSKIGCPGNGKCSPGVEWKEVWKGLLLVKHLVPDSGVKKVALKQEFAG